MRGFLMRAAAYLEHAARWLTIAMPALILAGPAPPDVGLSIIAVFFLVRSALARDFSWMKQRWLQLALALWAYMTLRELVLGGEEVVRGLSWVRFPLFAAALAVWILPDETTRKRLLACLSAVVAFLVFDTFWQYIFGADLFGREPVQEYYTLRLTGPLSSPRVGITIVWLMFPVLLYGLALPDRRYRLVALLLSIAAATAVYMSGERMAVILTFTGFAAAFALLPHLRRPMLIVALAALAALAAVSLQNPSLAKRQLETSYRQITDFWHSPYGGAWQSAFRIGQHYPLFGVGAKRFQEVCRDPAFGAVDEDSLTQRCPMHPHNIYFEWLVEGGLIALFLFIALVFTLGSNVVRGRPHWKSDAVTTALVITLALRLWPINTQTSQFPAWSAAPFWLMAGWLLAIALNAQKIRK